jgi:hypothetical protein
VKVSTLTISQADAAVVLRAKLGDHRSWPDFLADNIRGKQDLAGYTLLPCGRMKGVRGALRPVYAIDAIDDFIEKVKAALPEVVRKPIKATPLTVDTGRGWRLNTFDRQGAPLPRAGHRSA